MFSAKRQGRRSYVFEFYPKSIGESRYSHSHSRERYSNSHKRAPHSSRYSHYRRTGHPQSDRPFCSIIISINTSTAFRIPFSGHRVTLFARPARGRELRFAPLRSGQKAKARADIRIRTRGNVKRIRRSEPRSRAVTRTTAEQDTPEGSSRRGDGGPEAVAHISG